MSRKATEYQKKEMSKMYRGKEIFKPLNTGWIDEHVACVREWVANIFFYRKGGKTIMIDAGYNYDRLEEKMGWLGIDPKSIREMCIRDSVCSAVLLHLKWFECKTLRKAGKSDGFCPYSAMKSAITKARRKGFAGLALCGLARW